MASFLDNLNNDVNDLNNLTGSLSQSQNQTNDFTANGFIVPPIPNGDGTGLPSSKVPDYRVAEFRRDIIHWFVPEFGVVRMYVNPYNIQYQHKKLINKDRTKGGYILQYWGEDLTILTLSGTTGSSGIEGINVLYEIYRAEQLAFDAVGLSLAADNAAIGATNQIVSGIGDAVGSAIGSSIGGSFGGSVGGLLGAGIAQGIFGTDNFTSLAPRNITSLAQMAFGIEMFYSGWVYRGYFENMNITERADSVGLFEYTINFTTTQRRGYRFNSYPWQRSATSGPSNNDFAGGTPFSFTKLDQ
jgi:hypothetical protein